MLCSSRRKTRHVAVASCHRPIATSSDCSAYVGVTTNPNSKRWRLAPTFLMVAFVIVILQLLCTRCDGRRAQRSADQWIKLDPSAEGNGTSMTTSTTAQTLFTGSNIEVVTPLPSDKPSTTTINPPVVARPSNLNASVIVPHPGQPMATQPLFVSDMGQPSSVNALPHLTVTRRPPQSGSSSSTFMSAGGSTTQSLTPSKSIKHPSPTNPTRLSTKKINQTENNNSKSAINRNVNQKLSHTNITIAHNPSSNLTTFGTHFSNGSLTVPLADTLDDNNATFNDPLHKISMNAWSWHYHVFGIAFCLLAILSSYSLLHFVLCLNVVQRVYFFLSNVCLCMFCICRCCYVLQADAYRHISLSYAVAVYDSSTFLVTLAIMLLFGGACTFSEVQWWIFRPIRPLAVNSFVVPYTLITSSLLVAIAVVGSVWQPTEGATIYYMILVHKVVSVLWSLSFIILCWLLYGRLYKDSQRKQSQILRTELTKLHIEGTQLPRNIPKPCLCLCVRSLCVTSCLLLIHNALLVYGLIYSEDMVLSLLLGQTGSPSWWIYQNVTCVFEVGMCACLACGHCWSHCGHQCRSVLGRRFADWDFRRDVWQTSTQHLRRLSERGFRRRRGGSGIDNRCRTVSGADIGEDYDVIERLAGGGGGERDSEFPSSFFGIYGNGGNSVPGGRGVSSSTHFTFERWERSYNNGGKAVATNTSCLDSSDPVDMHPSESITNDITTRHPQHSHHYFHTATVRPVLKTFQRLSQVSPQRLQAQFKSSTLALQRKGRNVSSAVVSSLRSLTTSRRSSSSSSSSGNVAATAFGINGQHGLSVTPIKFSTSPRICSILGGNKADYVNVPNTALATNCGSQKHPALSHQKHSHHNQQHNIQDISEGVDGLVALRDGNLQDHRRLHHSVRKEILQSTPSVPAVPAHKGHTWFNFQQPSRKRYLNKRLLEKSAKRKSRHVNKDGCSGQESIDAITDSIPSANSIGHQQNYPCIATSTTSSSAFTNAAASCRQKFMEKRKSQRGSEKNKGKVKDFANKVLMVSRATQVYIPSPCKGNSTLSSITQNNFLEHHRCMQPKTQSRHHITAGESSSTSRRYKSGKSYFLPEIKTPLRMCKGGNDVEEEEGNDEEFEYEDDQDLISAVNKYSRSNSYHHRSHSTNTLSPYHGSQGALALAGGTQLKRSWHVANSSTSCSSESAANSFDVRFYVYSPSPGEMSPNGSMSSPSRDFHDHFYPKLYHHHHHHPRHHHRPPHNGSVKNIFSSHLSHRVDTTQLPESGHCEDKVLQDSLRYNRFLRGTGNDPYATVDRSGAGDIINCTKTNFLPRLVSNSLLDSVTPRTTTMTQHHFRTASDVTTGNGHHYAATQLIPPHDTLEVRCRGGGSSVSGSSGSSRPPSGASGQSEKQNSMYLSEDDDNRVEIKDPCCGIGQQQQHPHNLNLSLPLERDVYYPTVVKIKNPQDITPDSAVYLELNSPQTVDTPPTIREHPRRFPPFPCASTKNTAHPNAGLARTIASNESGAIALRKSASFGNLLQFNKTHHHHHPHHHHYPDEQRQQVVLQTLDANGRSINSTAAKRNEFPAPKLRSSLSMERLPSTNCCVAINGGAPRGRNDEARASDGECCGHQVRWRRWLSADELEPNSDSVYDSRDSVSFPSHDADEEELELDSHDVTSGNTSAACASQKASQCQVKTARLSKCV